MAVYGDNNAKQIFINLILVILVYGMVAVLGGNVTGCGPKPARCKNPLGTYQGKQEGSTFIVDIDNAIGDYQMSGKLTFSNNGKSQTCNGCTFTYSNSISGYSSNNCGESFDKCLKPLLELVGWSTDYYPYLSCYDDGTMYFVETVIPPGVMESVELYRER